LINYPIVATTKFAPCGDLRALFCPMWGPKGNPVLTHLLDPCVHVASFRYHKHTYIGVRIFFRVYGHVRKCTEHLKVEMEPKTLILLAFFWKIYALTL
jgi:hypothetical protein